MKKIDIGNITEFSNFSNGNDGITIYKKNKIDVKYYEFTMNGVLIWFDVLSMRNIVYKSKLSISNDMLLHDSTCSCPYKNKVNDVCKHIVAGYIYYINELKDKIKPSLNYNFSELDKGGDKHENIYNLKEIDKIGIKYILNIIDKNNLKLEMNIILDKVIPIPNILDFLNSIAFLIPYKINKNTYLNLSLDSFSDKDKTIINTLLSMHSLLNMECFNIENIFAKEYININNYLLKKLLDIIDENTLEVKYNDSLFTSCSLINGDFDISPIISTNEHGDITLCLNTLDTLRLYDNEPYFFYAGNIYKVHNSFITNYECLRNLISNNNTSYFTINEENKNDFLNNILPKLSMRFNLKISEDLNKIINIETCKCKFYIDKTSNDLIIIKVIFKYGKTEINPIEENILNTSILRDYKTENRVLNKLEDFCESKNSLYYIIKSPEKILKFKDEGIKSLKEFGEIFYTKKFKQYKLISSSSYKTSFGLGLDNLLNISFSFEGITNDELYMAIKYIRRGEKYLKLKDKGILDLDNKYLKEINSILNDLDINENDLKNNSLNVDKFYSFYINDMYSDSFKALGELDKNDIFIKITEGISNIDSIDLDPPKDLKASLRSYQLEGFKWLKTLKEYNLSGILADEMGLGKTLQTITFIQKEYENKTLGSAIIICPKSLIYNWYDEIKKFTNDLKVLIFNGNKNIRTKLLNDIKSYDIILTSYGIVQKDIDILKKYNFNICIIDEAQNIKNKSSKNTISLRELNVNHKFALTGTPIENSIDELWSIFNFLMPGYLHSHGKFKTLYEDTNNSLMLHKKISPFVLRRLKKNVLKELPPKIETKIMVDLNEDQKKLYYSYINKFKNEFDTKDSNDKTLKFRMLSALTRLRQICCDPRVISEDYDFGSSKIDLLMDILDEHIKNNKKIIVFSNFTSILEIIKEKFEKCNIKYKYLDGSIPSKDRLDIVNDFNKNDYNIFLISLKAGGFGLNITSAEIVIHFDPWWNNAVENQATDRAHRIGQKNTIHVIKLITKGTIEEKIFEIQERKNNLINSIIKDSDHEYNSLSKMSIDEIKDLFLVDKL